MVPFSMRAPFGAGLVLSLGLQPITTIPPRSFEPDGMRVAYASNRGGNWDIYVAHLDGTGLVSRWEEDRFHFHA